MKGGRAESTGIAHSLPFQHHWAVYFQKYRESPSNRRERGSHSFSVWWDFRNRNWTEETYIIKFRQAHTHIHIHTLCVFSQFQLRLFYLLCLFLKTYLKMKPFIAALPQTVCGSIIDNESAAKKWKCCFNNLGLKYILLYASKGFNKKSTCRDIFSWLKQQSKAYKCSPTIMTYL